MLKDENIAFLIGKVRRGLRREFDSRFKQVGITPAQYDLLSRLWEKNGLLMTELSNKVYKDGPTVTGLVDRLEKKKLLLRRKDEKDRRAIRIFLTEQGKNYEKALPKLVEKILEKAVSRFTHAEVNSLKNSLWKIWQNLEQ